MRPTYYPAGVVGLAGACLTALAIFATSNAATVGGAVLGAAALAGAIMLAVDTFTARRRHRRDRADHLAERLARQADRSEDIRAPRRFHP